MPHILPDISTIDIAREIRGNITLPIQSLTASARCSCSNNRCFRTHSDYATRIIGVLQKLRLPILTLPLLIISVEPLLLDEKDVDKWKDRIRGSIVIPKEGIDKLLEKNKLYELINHIIIWSRDRETLIRSINEFIEKIIEEDLRKEVREHLKTVLEPLLIMAKVLSSLQ